MSDSPAPKTLPPAASFAELKSACGEYFDVVLAVGGRLVPAEDGGQRREGARLMTVNVRRMTASESAKAADLLLMAVPKRVTDPQSGEQRYDLLDAEYVKDKRALEVKARAWICVRCVRQIEEGWKAMRREKGQADEMGDAPLEKNITQIDQAARWLADTLPEDVLELLRRAAESQAVDEEALQDFFSSGS